MSHRPIAIGGGIRGSPQVHTTTCRTAAERALQYSAVEECAIERRDERIAQTAEVEVEHCARPPALGVGRVPGAVGCARRVKLCVAERAARERRVHYLQLGVLAEEGHDTWGVAQYEQAGGTHVAGPTSGEKMRRMVRCTKCTHRVTRGVHTHRRWFAGRAVGAT